MVCLTAWRLIKLLDSGGGKILQQGLGIVAVDVFILISGWFSIKPKIISICNFLFQIFFLKCLSLIIFFALGKVHFSKDTFTELLMLKPDQGWFIKAYLLLYILSPVLNKFSENTRPKIFSNVLIAYWVFLFIFGWITESTAYINNYCCPIKNQNHVFGSATCSK